MLHRLDHKTAQQAATELSCTNFSSLNSLFDINTAKMTDTKRSRKKVDAQLTVISELRDTDICCGRGKRYSDHLGNGTFQKSVLANMEAYAEASSKRDRSDLVSEMVDSLMSSGARFVKWDTESEMWYDIGEAQARDKTGHAIRDHIMNRSKRRAQSGIAITVKAKTTKNQGTSLSTRSSSFATPKATSSTKKVPKQTEKSIHTNQIPDLVKLIGPTSHTVTRGFFFDSENKSMVSDYAERLMKEQIAMMHNDLFSDLSKPFVNHDLSTQEVFEVCSFITEGPISSYLPDDWL
jgi:hypothetical protein